MRKIINDKMKKLIIVLCVLLSLISISFSIHASEVIDVNAVTGVTIESDVVGSEFRLYKVAAVSEDGTFTPVHVFREYAVEVNGLDSDGMRILANTLAIYISRDKVEPIQTITVGEDGLAKAENLTTGLYLILGNGETEANNQSVSTAFMITLPYVSPGGYWDYNPLIEAKMEAPEFELTKCRVLKNWMPKESKEGIPEKIEVELLRNGEVVDTVELNMENNWSFIWENLDGDFEWKVTEKEVPDGYEVTIEEHDGIFTITNTLKETPSGSDNAKPNKPVTGGNISSGGGGSSLPRTGQLWWPVPVLTIAGLLFFLIGWVRRRNGDLNEE